MTKSLLIIIGACAVYALASVVPPPWGLTSFDMGWLSGATYALVALFLKEKRK